MMIAPYYILLQILSIAPLPLLANAASTTPTTPSTPSNTATPFHIHPQKITILSKSQEEEETEYVTTFYRRKQREIRERHNEEVAALDRYYKGQSPRLLSSREQDSYCDVNYSLGEGNSYDRGEYYSRSTNVLAPFMLSSKSSASASSTSAASAASIRGGAASSLRLTSSHNDDPTLNKRNHEFGSETLERLEKGRKSNIPNIPNILTPVPHFHRGAKKSNSADRPSDESYDGHFDGDNHCGRPTTRNNDSFKSLTNDEFNYKSNFQEDNKANEANEANLSPFNSLPIHSHTSFSLEQEGKGGALGLLRVPCSIAINSGEDGRLRRSHHRRSDSRRGYHPQYHQSHHYHGHHYVAHSMEDHHVKKTPIAAYVDTGAQVTVISASAARRAGILHLMDRRYAGRATGVGHCKVLGRIPARHVYFFLGGNDGSCGHGGRGGHVGDVGHGGHGGCDDVEYGDDPNGPMVQMDGPALTVLEGTVTQGVDVLLGLDVLQDWEAEIRMGAQKSITVKKKRARSSSRSSCAGGATSSRGAHGVALSSLQQEDDHGHSVVIPFVTNRRTTSVSIDPWSRREYGEGDSGTVAQHSKSSRSIKKMRSASAPSVANQYQNHRISNSKMPRTSDGSKHEEVAIDDEDDDFSPSASDVESDLDWLEQSKYDNSATIDRSNCDTAKYSQEINSMESNDNDLGAYDEEEDEDDYLQDIDEDDQDDVGSFDMSGL